MPRRGGTEEGDGWLLTIVGRRAQNRTDLVILDARHLSRGPVAVVKFPCRVHEGFHGIWISARRFLMSGINAMITLYGSLHSRANRCAWMLKELGVAFKSVPTNFQNGGTREPAFLKKNPNGRVPVLDDDGFYVFESLAINLYLARKFGGPLAPHSPQEDALATQWSFWAISEPTSRWC